MAGATGVGNLRVGNYAVWGDGVHDDTATIQAAINDASGGTVLIPPGTFGISSPITLKSTFTLQGAGAGTTVLKWIGATNSVMFQTPNVAGSPTVRCNLKELVFDANNVSGVSPLLLQSWQFSRTDNLLIQNVTGGTAAALRLEVNAGTSSTNNTVGNILVNTYLTNVSVGLQLAGQLGGSTTNFVTNNRFFGLYMDSVSSKGLRLIQWCDSNAWYGTQIALGTNNAQGIILNDSATPTSDLGVYNTNFFHLSIDSFNITGASGVVGNWAKQFLVWGFYHSPVVFNGTLFTDNNLQSYDVLFTQDGNSSNNLLRKSKNMALDSGGGAGLGAYVNYVVQTAQTTGNGPLLKAVGNDATVDLQLQAQGATGRLLALSDMQRFGGTRLRVQQTTAPTVGSPGSGVSVQSVIAGSTNVAGQVQATLTAVAAGVVVGVVTFNGAPLGTAPVAVVCSLSGPTAGDAAPPDIGADTYTTSGFTIRSYGP